MPNTNVSAKCQIQSSLVMSDFLAGASLTFFLLKRQASNINVKYECQIKTSNVKYQCQI